MADIIVVVGDDGRSVVSVNRVERSPLIDAFRVARYAYEVTQLAASGSTASDAATVTTQSILLRQIEENPNLTRAQKNQFGSILLGVSASDLIQLVPADHLTPEERKLFAIAGDAPPRLKSMLITFVDP